jgi:hypothetical protein
MRFLTAALACAGVCSPISNRLAGQQPDTAVHDSSVHDTAKPAPLPLTPAQTNYLEGLRSVNRGIAQLKDGVNRVTRFSRDTLRQRQAGRRLGGLCGTAHGFLVRGRARMTPAAYDPPTRDSARILVQRIDSVSAYTVTCERNAGRSPAQTGTDLLTRLGAYDKAQVGFRSAIGLPNKPDSSSRSSH